MNNNLLSPNGLSRIVTESMAHSLNPLSNPKTLERLIEASSPTAVLSRAIANGAFAPSRFVLPSAFDITRHTVDGLLRTIDNAQRSQAQRMLEIFEASKPEPLNVFALFEVEPAQLAPDEEGDGI